MGEHTHGQGGWMASYRYMHMRMAGNRGRGGELSRADVLADFMVAPLEMTMEMHMLGLMHAPSDDLTLMFMFPYIIASMDHQTRPGARFTTDSDGPGDIKISGLYKLAQWVGQQIHANLGVSLPTGSIEERDDTPAMANAKLPYPMQLGSGTFDILPGVTYLGQSGDYSWGAQARGTVRLGRNSSGYSLGDRGGLSVWIARRLCSWASSSVRVDGQVWENIDGSDDDLNPAMVPTADTSRRGGERIDVLFGLNLLGQESVPAGHRIAVEFGLPVYQAFDGPQLETDWFATIGWQFAWH